MYIAPRANVPNLTLRDHPIGARGDSSHEAERIRAAQFTTFMDQLGGVAESRYAKRLSGSLYDMLKLWPTSKPAIADLALCMQRMTQSAKDDCIIQLMKDIQTQLLRPGVNTEEILVTYTAAIRALRQLDPSNALMDIVCQPICEYLRHRKDTVRVIMHSISRVSSKAPADRAPLERLLIEEESMMASGVATVRERPNARRPSNSIHWGAAVVATAPLHRQRHSRFDEPPAGGILRRPLEPARLIGRQKLNLRDVELDRWQEWQPDPVFADNINLAKSRTNRRVDTIEVLMSIFGGQDIFMEEYQLILAEKLLGYYPYELAKERRHLQNMIQR